MPGRHNVQNALAAIGVAAELGIPDETKGELAKAYVVLKPATEATREELRTLLSLVRPKAVMPIHGEYRHMVANAKLGYLMGVPRDQRTPGADEVEVTFAVGVNQMSALGSAKSRSDQ